MAPAGMALLSVAETRDGVWSVNERGPSRVAVAYFPSKFGAVKHALRVARAKPRCRIAILERNGQVRLAREYDHGPAPSHVETP